MSDRLNHHVRGSREGELPKGFTCSCGVFTRFPGYVYAHWDDTFRVNCECGKSNTLRRGAIVPRSVPQSKELP